jgi:hypothetical protein
VLDGLEECGVTITRDTEQGRNGSGSSIPVGVERSLFVLPSDVCLLKLFPSDVCLLKLFPSDVCLLKLLPSDVCLLKLLPSDVCLLEFLSSDVVYMFRTELR